MAQATNLKSQTVAEISHGWHVEYRNTRTELKVFVKDLRFHI